MTADVRDGDNLPSGWHPWHDEPGGRRIVAFRPDIFDGEAFPPACMPTLVLSPTPPRGHRPPATSPDSNPSTWYVTLFLEPGVILEERQFNGREPAIRGLEELARAFVAGTFDHHGAYQVPRPAYLEALDALLHRDP